MPVKIQCQHCDKKFGCRKIYEHYDECLAKLYKKKSGYLISMHSHGITGDLYHIYVIAGTKCKFLDIDKFLKDIWCECCGHMSEYHISKKTSLNKYGENDIFIYEYDMGDTTTVYIEIKKILEGKSNNNKIKLVHQNEKPKILCIKCKINAKYYYMGDPLCKKHSDVSEEEPLAKISNSPRSGFCGYE